MHGTGSGPHTPDGKMNGAGSGRPKRDGKMNGTGNNWLKRDGINERNGSNLEKLPSMAVALLLIISVDQALQLHCCVQSYLLYWDSTPGTLGRTKKP